MLRLLRKSSARPETWNRWNRVHHREKHLSPQLTGQIRSHRDLQWIGCRKCRTKSKEKKLKDLDEVFFERGNKYAWDKCKNTENNTRELHLELGGDIVTYVRVYWFRSRGSSHDNRPYSSLSSKWGCHFYFKHFDVFSSCWVAFAHDLEQSFSKFMIFVWGDSTFENAIWVKHGSGDLVTKSNFTIRLPFLWH